MRVDTVRVQRKGRHVKPYQYLHQELLPAFFLSSEEEILPAVEPLLPGRLHICLDLYAFNEDIGGLPKA